MTPPLPIDLALRFATIAVVAGLGALGMAMPESVVGGGLAWLAFLMFAMSGWGWCAVKISRAVDPDFGLRAAWGAALYLAAIGIAIAVGVANRAFILGTLGVGFAGFAWRELVAPEAHWKQLAAGIAYLGKRPAVALAVIVLVAIVAVRIAGAVAQIDRNAWDDDVAYTPLLKRLLDAGNLIEPFSFRRLSAYGGQTALGALAAARGTLVNVHAIDKGLFFGLAMMLIVGEARSLGRVPGVWLAIIVAVFATLPDISINTASEWTGMAMILAMYRTVVRAGRSDDPHRRFALAALVGAAVCTLRQNDIPVVVLFLVLALATRLYNASRDQFFRVAWQQEWRSWRNGIFIAAVALVPWWIAGWESNRTFLFPIIDGTWNHGLSLKQTAYTWLDELQFLVWCCIETAPLFILQPMAVLILFTQDDRPARSLKTLFVSVVIGFVILVHSFTTADSLSIWRYAFGYATALAAVFALEVTNEPEINLVRLPPIGRWALVACLLLQLVAGRQRLPKMFQAAFSDIADASRGDPTAAAEAKRYAALQRAVPAGERLVVMLDDAAYLDFARNPIANLDTPGWASPGTQMPCFIGAEAMRAYFVAQGYRYFAFVRPERSRYFFRREFWVQRIFTDSEVFQAMSAYVIDAIDNAVALASSMQPIYDVDGLVVLDLGTSATPPPIPDPTNERARRSAWFAKLADGLKLHDAWSLNPREDVVFEDGFTGVTFLDGDEPKWFEVVKPTTAVPLRGLPVRWMHRRSHIRVHGDADMHLILRGRVNLNAVYTRPHVDVSIDGTLIASQVADDHGVFAIDMTVPESLLGGWHDLYIVFATVGEPEKDLRDLRAAWLEAFEWRP